MAYSQGKTEEKNVLRLAGESHRAGRREPEPHRHKVVTREQCREHLEGFMRRLGGRG